MSDTRLLTIATWLDDRINPIVVRELRQAVRSRLVVAVLMTFLVVLVSVIGFCLLAANYNKTDFFLGRSVFMGLQSIVLGAGLIFVPIYTGVRLAMEQPRSQMALLYITTIRPRSIIGGKILSSVALILLIYSISLPFLTITYLLRGIDVPTIFLVVSMHLLVILSAVIVAIFLASLPLPRIAQWLLGGCYLIALTITFSTTAIGSGAMVHQGAGSMIADPDFWQILLLVLFKTGLVLGLLFALSVAIISPPTSNRALAPRLYVTLAWLLSLAGAILSNYLVPAGNDFFLAFWVVEQVIVLILGLWIVVCEPDQMGLRLLSSIPQSKIKRPVFMLFYTGACGGIAWCTVMIFMTLIVCRLLNIPWDPHSDLAYMLPKMTALALYAYSYAMTAVFLRRIFRVKPEFTIAFALGLLTIGVLVPLVIAFLLNPLDPNFGDGWWLLTNPLGALIEWNNDSFITACLWTTAAWAILATVINGKWLIRQARSFLNHNHTASPPTVNLNSAHQTP